MEASNEIQNVFRGKYVLKRTKLRALKTSTKNN